MWAKIVIQVNPKWPRVICEFCGHVFEEGETVWRRVKTGHVGRRRRKGSPLTVGCEEKDIFRCQKCYEMMWY